MSKFRKHSNWNEFRWESEMRRDERRINRYFAHLESCIDLPGEEDIIFGQIAERADLVPTGMAAANPDALRNRCYVSSSEDEEDGEFTPSPAALSIVNLLDAMTCQWNQLAVEKLFPDFFPQALGVSCAYAKLLARTADFIHTDNGESGLKRTLGKRVLADLNELADALSFVADHLETVKILAAEHRENLAQIHDQMTFLLNRIKNG